MIRNHDVEAKKRGAAMIAAAIGVAAIRLYTDRVRKITKTTTSERSTSSGPSCVGRR